MLDALGRSLAPSVWSVPSCTGTLPITLKHRRKEYPVDTRAPGDSLITNDPWMGTGHLPALTIVTPICRDGRLVACVGRIAHAPDMGGRGVSGECRQAYEEGLPIPLMKLCRRGDLNPTLVRTIQANVRVPDQVRGDIHAPLAANATGGRRLLSLMEERRLDELMSLAGVLHARAAAARRAALEKIPAGAYRHVVTTDGFDEPSEMHCPVTGHGSQIQVDDAGTSAQIERGINCVMNYSYAYSLLRGQMPDESPHPQQPGGLPAGACDGT